uniref:Abi family protein n=1 Tax=Erwinia amylovora TaxID=552 RepID=UPI001178081F
MDTILDSLSSQRIDIYKKYMECDSDDEAVGLYLWNANLSREIGTIINIIEVSLRNSIQQSYMNINGTDENWLTTYFDSLPASNEGRKRINEVRSRIHKSSGVTINDIISRLHFGFWSSICSDEHLESKPDSLKMWPKMLDSVFKGRGHFTQSDIFSMIVRANYTRNRISHNEVVWKEDKRCGVFSVVRSVQEVCNNLFELARIIGIGNVKIIEMNDIFERISNFCN